MSRASFPSARFAHLLQEVVRRLPLLETITIRTHAAPDAESAARLIEYARVSTGRALRCSVEFVLEGSADAGAALGGESASLTSILQCSRALRGGAVPVRWRIPLIPALVHRLESLYSLARDEDLDPLVIHAASPAPPLDADERLFAWDFVTYRLLGQERAVLSPRRLAAYRELQATLDDVPGGRTTPTHPVVVIRTEAIDGSLRWHLMREERPGLPVPPEDGASKSATLAWGRRLEHAFRSAGELIGVLWEGVRGVHEWTRALGAGGTPVTSDSGEERRFPTALVIGAYGGDHIGDTAILGGVLLRMHREHGLTRAILMSQRPSHTRHLVRMLETPVEVTVEEYRQSRVPALLGRVDAVIFAGGPLMDLPKQLVKHLYTVSRARREHKPFFVEGIGAGPFLRWASAWTGRRLVRMANQITLRTSADRAAPMMRGLEARVGRDPAFDYLETRPSVLTRLPERDRQWIEDLLRDTAGRTTVGLNIRPLRHDYTAGTTSGKRAEFTRRIEARFEERLAEALRRLHHRDATTPPCFIFFPMNAIQFGLSDLRSAYRIKRLLRDDVDFRIWEDDASLDGVVALLRRLDRVVTMRFHATIFALTQERRVIGIDYRIGKRDKVAALLHDAGRSDDCARIDEMTADWLYERLTADS